MSGINITRPEISVETTVTDTEYGGPGAEVIDQGTINPGEPVLVENAWLNQQYDVMVGRNSGLSAGYYSDGYRLGDTTDVRKVGTIGPSNPRLKFTVPDSFGAGDELVVYLRGPDGNIVGVGGGEVEPYPSPPAGVPDDALTSDPAEHVDNSPSPSDIATNHPLIVPADNEEGIAPAPVLRRRGVELGPEGATFRFENGESVEVGAIEEADEVARYISGENAGDVVEGDQDVVDETNESGGSNSSSSSDLGAGGAAAALAVAYLIYRRQ